MKRRGYGRAGSTRRGGGSRGRRSARNIISGLRGTPKVYLSSEHGRRHFCPDCGTGLFYDNAEMLPGIIDIQSATYDDPDSVPARAHIQVAERIRWMERAHELPAFERYPPREQCCGRVKGLTSASGQSRHSGCAPITSGLPR